MNYILFFLCGLIWGSTWLTIKYQLGVVDPMLSIFYRFAMAVTILFTYCIVTRKSLRYAGKDHLFFLIIGALMFGVNYWLVYVAEAKLPSGLAAICFTTLIFLNTINNRIFLKTAIVPKILLGGSMGIFGLVLIFYQELEDFSISDAAAVSLLFCLFAALSVSLGNTAAQVCQRRNIPVIQMQLFSMAYGSALIGATALLMGVPIVFDTRTAYITSLLYLGTMGSTVAFLSYLTLLKNIGSDKAAYVTLMQPLVALALSTVFEGYVWSAPAVAGVGIIILGNVIALRKPSTAEIVTLQIQREIER